MASRANERVKWRYSQLWNSFLDDSGSLSIVSAIRVRNKLMRQRSIANNCKNRKKWNHSIELIFSFTNRKPCKIFKLHKVRSSCWDNSTSTTDRCSFYCHFLSIFKAQDFRFITLWTHATFHMNILAACN